MVESTSVNTYRYLIKEFQDVIDGIKRMGTLLGLSDSCASVLAIMYLIREPLTIDELTGLTHYSRTTLFNCLRHLERLGLVNRRRVGRRFAYIPISRPSRIITSRLHEILERCIRPIVRVLEHRITLGLEPSIEVKAKAILEDLKGIEKVLLRLIVEVGPYG